MRLSEAIPYGPQQVTNRHKRPIASHSERVFVRAKLLDPLPRSRTNLALAPMSRAELEYVLARGLKVRKSG